MSAPMFSFVYISRGLCSSYILKVIKNDIRKQYISKFSHWYISNSFFTTKGPTPVLLLSNLNSLANEQYNVNKTLVRCMAGHAKWQNVLHTKLAKDREKVKMCEKYSRLVRYAVAEGGADPKLNSRLADVIAEAHRHSVPFSAMEHAMKTPKNLKTKEYTVEIIGPGGCFLIFEFETGNISITRHSLKQIVKKYGGALPAGEGRWRAAYEQRGLIKVVGKTGEETLNSEIALDCAIEAGAEDVQTRKDENNQIYFEFFCAPDDLHSVKKQLEDMQYKIEEAYIAYIPNVMVELSKEDLQNAGNLINDLEDMSESIRLYDNVQ